MSHDRKRTVAMLFSNSFLPHQGRFQRVYNEARSLVEAGYRVVILAWDRAASHAAQEEMDGIEIVRFRYRSREKVGPVIFFNMLRYMLAAFFWIVRHRVDVVHCHNLDVTAVGTAAGRLKRAKVIFDFCEPDYYTYWDRKWNILFRLITAMERFLTRRCDCLLVHNRYQVDKYTKAGVKKIVHIGSYPFREMILPEVEPKERGDVVIGRIGTVYENNGIEEIVAAFKLLSARHPNVRLLLAGRVLDVYRPTFDALIEPIRDKVEQIGAFDSADMPALYAKIDISLMVYVLDDWFRNITPTKFFDSLACGVPVIISDMGGIRELMGDRPCGIVVDSLEPEVLTGAVEKLAADPDLRLTMARNGLCLVKESCSWEIMEKRLLDAFSELCPR